MVARWFVVCVAFHAAALAVDEVVQFAHQADEHAAVLLFLNSCHQYGHAFAFFGCHGCLGGGTVREFNTVEKRAGSGGFGGWGPGWPEAAVATEIPRPAGKSAGLRDDIALGGGGPSG